MRHAAVVCAVTFMLPATVPGQVGHRARDIGVAPGIFQPGPNNAITDVSGVIVGQVTVIQGDSVFTGVTAIRPHPGNLFLDRVPAAIVVGNGFGKLVGSTQVNELGELETPVLLTCTLCVWRAADAMVGWMMEQRGMEGVRSINPVVGETNDGVLSDIRARPITASHVRQALDSARGGRVTEGSVGAGTGTIAFGWKGGIGTASRVLPPALGGYSVGALVQTNFGGVLQILGAPVGRELGRYSFREAVEAKPSPPRDTVHAHERGDGSIMIVVATDAPVTHRNLERIAKRAFMGLSRTGSAASNGSGDYVVAFSVAESVRHRVRVGASGVPTPRTQAELDNDDISPLFQAVLESTEEAIYNSLFAATAVPSRRATIEALPLDKVRLILDRFAVSRR